MPIDFTAHPLPLRYDETGTIRVGNTRVRLDTVIGAFHEGDEAEDIVAEYPSLDLADVYDVIAFYLRHRADVDAYLAEQERRAAELRARIERGMPRRNLRDQLLARMAAGAAPA